MSISATEVRDSHKPVVGPYLIEVVSVVQGCRAFVPSTADLPSVTFGDGVLCHNKG